MQRIELTLPWPPSINNYYGYGKKKVFLKSKTKKYFEDCFFCIYEQIGKIKTIESKIKVTRKMYPPDKRRRDEDNICKALNDCLIKSGVIKDDSQIIDAHNLKLETKKGGEVKLIIEELKT